MNYVSAKEAKEFFKVTGATWIGYRNLDSGAEITLSDLTLYLILGVFSWIAFVLAILIMNGDKIVLKKK